MRPRFVIALAALAALSACDQAGQKGGAARAPIAGAPAAGPATVAAAPPSTNCPAVQPACPTPHAAKAAKVAVARKAHARRYAYVPPPAPPRAKAAAARAYVRRDDGLPHRPYRYEELPRDRQAVITLPYAEDHVQPPRRPHYPPPYAYRRWSAPEGYARRDEDRERDVYRYEERRAPRYYAPPAEDREAYGGRYGYGEQRRWGERDDRAELAPPPPPPAPRPLPPPPPQGSSHEHYEHYDRAAGGYDRYGQAYRADEHREYRSYSEESSVGSGQERDCCTAGDGQAAGFDAHGYLTWPGKTPR